MKKIINVVCKQKYWEATIFVLLFFILLPQVFASEQYFARIKWKNGSTDERIWDIKALTIDDEQVEYFKVENEGELSVIPFDKVLHVDFIKLIPTRDYPMLTDIIFIDGTIEKYFMEIKGIIDMNIPAVYTEPFYIQSIIFIPD